MADELELDPKIARRAGLLHDIGKALDHDMEGTHVEIGVEILKKYKENPLIINAERKMEKWRIAKFQIYTI